MNNIKKITVDMVKSALPKRALNSHKGNFGTLINIAGSATMGGAAMLSTLSALRCGAGLVTLATPRKVAFRTAPHLMEATTLLLPENDMGQISMESYPILEKHLAQATGCLIGCGLSISNDIKQIVKNVIENIKCPIIIDADAISALSSETKSLKNALTMPILTPHIGEMANLLNISIDEFQKKPLELTKAFAVSHNSIIVLKSHKTLIITPNENDCVYINTTGNPALAKGGSGDILAGMIASFVTQGMNQVKACICGIYLHGLAADRLVETMSEYSIIGQDIINELPYTMKSINI